MKSLKYIVLALFIFIWMAGMNTNVLNLTNPIREGQDGYQFGDLYRLCNLAQFKEPRKACAPYEPHVKLKTPSKKVNLYILGDSFTEPERIHGTYFDVDQYQYVHWGNVMHLQLDTTATNLLVVEIVERHVRDKFTKPISNFIPDTVNFIQKPENPKFMHKLDDAFSSKNTESRLDMLLLQNNLVMQVKEWKAGLNYRFFDRVSDGVTLVNDGQDVVYHFDTNPAGSTSSFSELEKDELDSIVVNINRSAALAKKMGFDEAILSIIPNKVSIVDPEYGTYNHLIERVQSHPNLQVPFVDTYSVFKKMGKSAYLKGDTHWTCEGQAAWLAHTNILLKFYLPESR
jgi:hypothetical protein